VVVFLTICGDLQCAAVICGIQPDPTLLLLTDQII